MAGVVKNMMVRVGADLSGLIGGFKKAGGATSSFAKQASDALRGTTLSHANLTKAMAQGDKNTYIVSLTDQIRELEQEQKALKAAGFSWGYEGFEKNEALLRSLKNELNDYIKSVQMADGEAEKFEASTKDAFSSVKTKAGGATDGVEGLLRSVKRLGIVSLGLRFVRSIFGELGSIVHQYISENDALQAQVNALKSSLGQALAPAINVVTNALAKLMPYIVGISNAISSLISNLFGSSWTTVADGANAAAKAIGGAGSATNDLKRSLQGFDEINKVNEKNSGGGGGGTFSAISAVEGSIPSWVSSWTELIKQSIATGDWESVGEALALKLSQVIGNLDLTVLMKKLPSLQKALTTFFEGWYSGISWESIGESLKTNITGFFQNFDLASVIQSGLKSVFAGNPIAQAALDGMFGNIREYFSPYIDALSGEYELIGEQIFVGVLMGMADAVLSAGKWLKSYILDPLVGGFKKVFQIHSPAAHPEIRGIGKNIILGVFEGILEIAKSPIDWIKTNVFDPISKAMQSLFDRKTMAKFNVSVKNTASKWWQDVNSWWRQKAGEVQAFKTNVKNDAVFWWQNVLTWWSGEVDEVYPFKVNVKNDSPTWWQNVVTWWNNTIGAVTFGAELRNNAATWWNNAKSWWTNTIGAVTFGAKIRDDAATWWNNLKKWWNEKIGTLELKIKLPQIEVEWAKLSALGQTFNYPKSFKVKWNAMGAILDGAQLFGMAGNTFLGGGEAGREALLPLDRHTWWMDKVADKVAQRVNVGPSDGCNITVNLVLDGKVITSTVVRNINAQARATGRNPLAASL